MGDCGADRIFPCLAVNLRPGLQLAEQRVVRAVRIVFGFPGGGELRVGLFLRGLGLGEAGGVFGLQRAHAGLPGRERLVRTGACRGDRLDAAGVGIDGAAPGLHLGLCRIGVAHPVERGDQPGGVGARPFRTPPE